ncbi:MAG TPA: AsmA family protein [Usitatibacter sp.]|jgi:uncharacterized protein involved in outer membrane biogenesis|nr:AsmA family protein [Usitatibacter sp.]
MSRPPRIALIVVLVIVLLPVLAVGTLVLAAKTQWGERWLEARASRQLQREVQIDGISFGWGWPPRIVFAHLKIGNPKWATTPALVDADGLYARVMIPPLFTGRVVIPYLGANRAQAGLEMDGDRATWKFGTPEGHGESRLFLGMVYLGDGHIVFRSKPDNTDLQVEVKGSAGEHGVLDATAKGTFRGEEMQAKASVPDLSPQHESLIHVDGQAKVGRTEGTAKGAFSTDAAQLDLDLTLAGQNLKDLDKLSGMTLPETPPYKLNGRLQHKGNDWIFDPFEGRIGASDIGGSFTYEKGKQQPLVKANLKSKLLDFGDLGPLVGAPPGARSPKNPEQQAQKEQRQVEQRLLPDKPFSTDAWGKMDADVTLASNRIQRPRQLPITALSTHLLLKDGVMHLQPLKFGIAEGHITADITLDGKQKPMTGKMQADVQGLHLAALFPTSQTMQDALGTLYGRAQLSGHGDSVADLLGTSDGKIALAIDGGQIKALLDALIPLQMGEVVMLLGKNNQKVRLRCGVADITVQNGDAKASSFVLDTENTEIKVHGDVNFANEKVDVELDPYPKQPGILSLRTPIRVEGVMRQPKPKPKAGPLAARAAAALGLAAINPALAVLATLENGPGKDTDCGKVLAEARAHGAQKKQS